MIAVHLCCPLDTWHDTALRVDTLFFLSSPLVLPYWIPSSSIINDTSRKLFSPSVASSFFTFLFLLFFFLSPFSLSWSMFAGQELRSTDRPIYGLSALTLNDTVYFYGGHYAVPPWDMEAMWKIPNTVSTSQFTQLATDPYASPALIYGSLVPCPLNNQLLYTFGGHHPETVDPALPPEPMRYYMLDMASLAWSPLQKVNSTTAQPLERYWHSTALYGNTAYIFGGMNITGPLDDYFWAYDFASDGWRSLLNTAAAQDIPARCGHTANMLR